MPDTARTVRKRKSDSSASQSSVESNSDSGVNLVTVDGVSYDVDSLPEEVKALLNDLLRFNHEAEELQYRLRQVQAAQHTYYETIKAQLSEKGVKAYQG